MYGEILVPLDGSNLVERALPCATTVVRAGHAWLRLMRMVSSAQFTPIVPLTAYALPQAHGDAEKAGRDAEACLGGRIALPAGDSSVETVAYAGDPASLIADEARSRSVHLIIMATHGRGRLARMIMCSIARGILHQANVPVLLYRPSALPWAVE